MTVKALLKHRNIWMGIAMLWVVWYHTNLKASFTPLEHLRILGYGGVDLCLFASGAGCYLSLCRDSDPWRFMKRRFSRLLPTYFLFIPVWILFCFLTGSMTWRAALGNLLGVQCFTGHGSYFNWYISAIFLFYLLSPVLKSMADHYQGILRHTAILLLLIVFSLPFWSTGDLLNIATRFPIFYLGMLLGKRQHQDAPLGKPAILASFAGTGTGMVCMLLCYRFAPQHLWDWGLLWYPFLLITPGMCIAISLIAEKLNGFVPAKPVFRALDIIGRNSFELYLIHIFVNDIHEYLNDRSLITGNTSFVWAVNFAGIILGTVALRLCSNALRKAMGRATSNR